MLSKNKERSHSFVVGDIVYASWGYDQTNVDFYQVIALHGKLTVELREIRQDVIHTGYMSGECSPREGDFIGEPFRSRVRYGTVNVKYEQKARKLQYEKIGGKNVYEKRYWSSYA